MRTSPAPASTRGSQPSSLLEDLSSRAPGSRLSPLRLRLSCLVGAREDAERARLSALTGEGFPSAVSLATDFAFHWERSHVQFSSHFPSSVALPPDLPAGSGVALGSPQALPLRLSFSPPDLPPFLKALVLSRDEGVNMLPFREPGPLANSPGAYLRWLATHGHWMSRFMTSSRIADTSLQSWLWEETCVQASARARAEDLVLTAPLDILFKQVGSLSQLHLLPDYEPDRLQLALGPLTSSFVSFCHWLSTASISDLGDLATPAYRHLWGLIVRLTPHVASTSGIHSLVDLFRGHLPAALANPAFTQESFDALAAFCVGEYVASAATAGFAVSDRGLEDARKFFIAAGRRGFGMDTSSLARTRALLEDIRAFHGGNLAHSYNPLVSFIPSVAADRSLREWILGVPDGYVHLGAALDFLRSSQGLAWLETLGFILNPLALGLELVATVPWQTGLAYHLRSSDVWNMAGVTRADLLPLVTHPVARIRSEGLRLMALCPA